MVLSYRIAHAEIRNALELLLEKRLQGASWKSRVQITAGRYASLGFIAIVIVIPLLAVIATDTKLALLAVYFVVASFFGGGLFAMAIAPKYRLLRELSAFLQGQYTVTLLPEALQVDFDKMTVDFPWPEVTACLSLSQFLVLTISNGRVVVVPVSAFHSTQNVQAFRETLAGYGVTLG